MLVWGSLMLAPKMLFTIIICGNMSWAEAWSIHFIDPHLLTVLSLTVVLLLVHFSGYNYSYCTPCGGSPDVLISTSNLHWDVNFWLPLI